MSFDLSDYVDVAEREAQFFERYPHGRIQVDLEDVRQGDVIVAWKAKATIWRTPEDPIPVCDFAVEPVPGKTPYTKDSEAMNASTSAVGRAIVLAGFPSKKVASADEVRNRQGNGFVDLPAIPEDAKPSEYVIHFGKNRGTLLGSLNERQLKWYANEWQVQEEPSDYDLRLKAAAVQLATGEDTPLNSVPDDMADVPFS
jgi:hypothetical protein